MGAVKGTKLFIGEKIDKLHDGQFVFYQCKNHKNVSGNRKLMRLHVMKEDHRLNPQRDRV